MGPRLKVPDNRPHRAAARRASGPLRHLQVKPAIHKRYLASAAAFVTWARQQGFAPASDDAALERQLSLYIEQLWFDGDPRAAAGDCLSAVQYFLGRRRAFPQAWALFTAWGRNELPDRAVPFTPSSLAAFAGVALAAGRWDVAALLVTGFHEVTSLQRHQVDLRADGCAAA